MNKQEIELISHNNTSEGTVQILNMVTELSLDYAYYPTISAFVEVGDVSEQITSYLEISEVVYSKTSSNKFKLFCTD